MNLTERQRAYVYRILAALGLLAAFYGLATAEEVALWLGLGGTILGNGLAAANTSTAKHAADNL